MLVKKVLMDRILGGWAGKNAGGTLGGPLEGRMELMNVRFYTKVPEGALSNDDLDLQLLNLHVLEQYGPAITARHIAQEWKSHVFFPFDEYGYALTNLRRGLIPPLSGSFDNPFTDCMGSPIRSELWAMAACGDAETAAYYAREDALVDHAGGEGVWGEVFNAVMQTRCLAGDGLIAAARAGLAQIDPKSPTAAAVRTALSAKEKGLSWEEARENILAMFPTDNFTYAPINIGFTLIGLLYGKDFASVVCIAANCGWDTDCTAATAGATYGLMHGYQALPKEWMAPLGDDVVMSREVNGFTPPGTLQELTARTLRLIPLVRDFRQHVKEMLSQAPDAKPATFVWCLPNQSPFLCDLEAEITYGDGHPALSPGREKTIHVTLRNRMPVPWTGAARLKAPEEVAGSCQASLALAPGSSQALTFQVRAIEALNDHISLSLCLDRSLGPARWDTQTVPIPLIPAREWVISAGNKGGAPVSFPGSAIDFAFIYDSAVREYRAQTVLFVPSRRTVELVASAAGPVTLLLDRKEVLKATNISPLIPAYHRSDPNKRVRLTLEEGNHTLTLTFSAAVDNPPKAFFNIVYPRESASCACDTEIRFLGASEE